MKKPVLFYTTLLDAGIGFSLNIDLFQLGSHGDDYPENQDRGSVNVVKNYYVNYFINQGGLPWKISKNYSIQSEPYKK